MSQNGSCWKGPESELEEAEESEFKASLGYMRPCFKKLKNEGTTGLKGTHAAL